ncbi:hypothetical protein V8G54_016445 [Vigna mungo]|uniref:Uncharacterized protein n=1 Tax=Vigna mungo TaxID=3915 RepID=A0AAQ3NL92_VIGMU
MLCVNPSLPRLTCRLSDIIGLTSICISHLFRGSPRISSLVLPSFGNCPNGNGPGISTCFTPFVPGGGGLNESNNGIFFFLLFSGAFPVHGRGIVGGANGRNAGSRIAIGFVFGVSE